MRAGAVLMRLEVWEGMGASRADSGGRCARRAERGAGNREYADRGAPDERVSGWKSACGQALVPGDIDESPGVLRAEESFAGAALADF